MTEPEHQEIFIIKRHSGHEDAPHGGAWKIAFADFMTAMMALFLVLWLISSTSDKTKHTVAQYFNPVKLVDMTTLKKGFRDPKDTEMGSGPNVKESQDESVSSQRNPSKAKEKEDVTCQSGPNAPARAEAALFRDPYAVLAEIAASAPAASAASAAASSAATADAAGTFKDPFTTTPHQQETLPDSLLPLAKSSNAQGKDTEGKDTEGQDTQTKGADEHPDVDGRHAGEAASTATPSLAAASQSGVPPDTASHGERSAEAARAAEAAKLKSELAAAHLPDLPHIEVQVTAEGILISLADDAHYSMFAIGSAEPQPQTVQVMERIGRILKSGPGSIIIRGHTDGRPYKSTVYDNWRLSSARAHMALYMLARGGLSEKRIENVEGYADHRLKIPNNPNASENRRIEILLRKEKP